jgi:hypothetical protein
MMKLLLLLPVILSLAAFPSSPPCTIKLGELQPNQRIELDWQYQACFNSEHYRLTFSSTLQVQVKMEKINSPGAVGQQGAAIPVTRKQLSELDESLSSYPSADGSNFQGCIETETITLTLYTDKAMQATEVIKACAPTKIGSLINTLKEGQFPSRLNRAAVN